MKIQTKALLKEFTIDEQDVLLDKEEPIFLEFSAIDTGGGFKDPILDFSLSVSSIESKNHGKRDIVMVITNPEDSGNEVKLSYQGEITITENEINGRIAEEKLPKEVIRFVFTLFN